MPVHPAFAVGEQYTTAFSIFFALYNKKQSYYD